MKYNFYYEHILKITKCFDMINFANKNRIDVYLMYASLGPKYTIPYCIDIVKNIVLLSVGI